MNRHFKEGALTFTIYHGPTRRKKLQDIESYDIILSNYETLKADCPILVRGKQKNARVKNSGTLYDVQWHRVVLDEGRS
jgi:SNF2 family DNA or RNA helicase